NPRHVIVDKSPRPPSSSPRTLSDHSVGEARGLLCLGGSFNPPHIGHLLTARAAAEAGNFCGVRLVVARHSPFKTRDDQMLSVGRRLSLCRLATLDAGPEDFQWVVDDREALR